MKIQFTSLIIGLVAISSFAQRKELKAVEKAIKKNDFANALVLVKSLDNTIDKADDKYKAKYYFLKGKIFTSQKKISEAADSFNKLLKFEKKIGSQKYTQKVTPVLNKIIQDVSNKAIKFYSNDKNYKEASKYFYLTYKLSPRDTVFAFNAAVSATQAKEYDKALKYYKELRKVGYTGIENQYVATDKSSGEVKTFNSKQSRDLMVKSGKFIKPQIKKTKSKNATIVKNIALILKEQGKTDEAIAAIQEARKTNPKDLNLILNEADLYIKLKKMDMFAKLMAEAVKLDPNNAMLYYNLGVVNANQGRVEEAKKFYKKAIELKPDYSDAYMNMSAIILTKDKAIVDEMNKNLSNIKKFNELSVKQKNIYKEALPFLVKADKLNRNINTVRTLMNIYEVIEDKAKAKKFRNIYKSMK